MSKTKNRKWVGSEINDSLFFLPAWWTNYLFWYIYYILLRVSSTIMLIFRRTNCISRTRLKHDGTCAETRFVLSAKRTNPFKLTWGQFIRLLAAEVCTSAVVMVAMFWGVMHDCWLPTPLACFPFTSTTVRHRVPSGFNWALHHLVSSLSLVLS